MTGQLGWGSTSRIGCPRPQRVTHCTSPSHFRNCWAPHKSQNVTTNVPLMPPPAGRSYGQMAQFLPIIAHNPLHNFQPFCPNPRKPGCKHILRKATCYFHSFWSTIAMHCTNLFVFLDFDFWSNQSHTRPFALGQHSLVAFSQNLLSNCSSGLWHSAQPNIQYLQIPAKCPSGPDAAAIQVEPVCQWPHNPALFFPFSSGIGSDSTGSPPHSEQVSWGNWLRSDGVPESGIGFEQSSSRGVESRQRLCRAPAMKSSRTQQMCFGTIW